MKLNTAFFLIFTFYASANIFTQVEKPTIYLLPGQGADHRLFSKLKFQDHKVVDIKYHIPKDGTNMADYAFQLSSQIDSTENFILIGASLGGMLACEMNEFLNPEKVIIISSAKCNKELPRRYNFQKKFPIYKLIGGGITKIGALILQPIVEPDRNKEKEIFKSMLRDKDKKFMKNSVRMIIEWDKTHYDDSIIHIHGNEDNTIPIKNVDYHYLIENGSHMITLTRAEEINNLLLDILSN